MSIISINEPESSRPTSLLPASPNQPPVAEDFAPVLTSIGPDTAPAGSEPVTVSLSGSNFISGFTRVKFGEGDLEPKIQGPSDMTIVLDPSVFEASTVQCSVYNGEYQSEQLEFTFT